MTALLIKLFLGGKNIRSVSGRSNAGNLGSVVGIICNILLCAFKITVGLISGSISIVADGLNNLADMGSAVITMIGFRLASKPADSDHPFGHGRLEYISAFIIAVLILIVGFELLTSSVKLLISGEASPLFSTAAIIVLAASILVKLWLFFFNRKLGRMIDSSALIATAKDSLNDCISTGAILLTAVITTFVRLPFNLDAVMAIGVALFILWSGYTSAKDTIDEMLGGPPSAQVVKEIEEAIMSFQGFIGIHDLIVHNYGPGRQFASVHVEVPQNIDIVACHEQIDLCEKFVGEKTGVNLVIHMDPIDTDDESVGRTKELITAAIKTIDERLTLHDFRMTPTASKRTNLVFDVVIPAGFKMTPNELNTQICQKAREIDSTYACVITFDSDFIG